MVLAANILYNLIDISSVSFKSCDKVNIFVRFILILVETVQIRTCAKHILLSLGSTKFAVLEKQKQCIHYFANGFITDTALSSLVIGQSEKRIITPIFH